MDRVEELCQSLRRMGERVTRARRAVLEVLVASPRHLNAEEITAAVQATAPEIHRATVYRTLDALTRLGVTEHTHLGHGPAVYHLGDDLHHHLVCESCGAVTEVDEGVFADVARLLRQAHGFEMRPLHFAVVGRCASCAAASSALPG